MGTGDNQNECADTTQGPSPTEEMCPTEGWGCAWREGGVPTPRSAQEEGRQPLEGIPRGGLVPQECMG